MSKNFCSDSLVYLRVSLVCEDEDAGDSDTPKRSSKPLSLNEKMDVLDLTRKEKTHVQVAKICGKEESSV